MTELKLKTRYGYLASRTYSDLLEKEKLSEWDELAPCDNEVLFDASLQILDQDAGDIDIAITNNAWKDPVDGTTVRLSFVLDRAEVVYLRNFFDAFLENNPPE